MPVDPPATSRHASPIATSPALHLQHLPSRAPGLNTAAASPSPFPFPPSPVLTPPQPNPIHTKMSPQGNQFQFFTTSPSPPPYPASTGIPRSGISSYTYLNEHGGVSYPRHSHRIILSVSCDLVQLHLLERGRPKQGRGQTTTVSSP